MVQELHLHSLIDDYDRQPALWIGNLAEYNNFNLTGAWYTMAQLTSGIKFTHGNPDDEHFIGDHEYMPKILNVSEYTSVPWLIDLAKTRPGAVLFSTDWNFMRFSIDLLHDETFSYYQDEEAVMELIGQIVDDYGVSNWFNSRDWHDSLASARVALSDYDQTSDWHVIDNLEHIADSKLLSVVDSVIDAMQQALLDAAEEEL